MASFGGSQSTCRNGGRAGWVADRRNMCMYLQARRLAIIAGFEGLDDFGAVRRRTMKSVDKLQDALNGRVTNNTTRRRAKKSTLVSFLGSSSTLSASSSDERRFPTKYKNSKVFCGRRMDQWVYKLHEKVKELVLQYGQKIGREYFENIETFWHDVRPKRELLLSKKQKKIVAEQIEIGAREIAKSLKGGGKPGKRAASLSASSESSNDDSVEVKSKRIAKSLKGKRRLRKHVTILPQSSGSAESTKVKSRRVTKPLKGKKKSRKRITIPSQSSEPTESTEAEPRKVAKSRTGKKKPDKSAKISSQSSESTEPTESTESSETDLKKMAKHLKGTKRLSKHTKVSSHPSESTESGESSETEEEITHVSVEEKSPKKPVAPKVIESKKLAPRKGTKSATKASSKVSSPHVTKNGSVNEYWRESSLEDSSEIPLVNRSVSSSFKDQKTRVETKAPPARHMSRSAVKRPSHREKTLKKKTVKTANPVPLTMPKTTKFTPLDYDSSDDTVSTKVKPALIPTWRSPTKRSAPTPVRSDTANHQLFGGKTYGIQAPACVASHQELDVILEKKDVSSLFNNNSELRRLESDFHTIINYRDISGDERGIEMTRRALEYTAGAKGKRLTHFISIPLNQKGNLSQAFLEFREKVLSQCHNVTQSIFMPVEKLHLTMSVHALSDDNLPTLCSIIESAVKTAKLGELQIRLKGINVMRGSPAQCHVLYAQIEECRALEDLKTAILLALIEQGYYNSLFVKHSTNALSKAREYELHWNSLFAESKKTTDASPPPYPFHEVALKSSTRKRRRFGRILGSLLVLGMFTAWGAYVLSGKRVAEEQLVPGAQEITVPATQPLENPSSDPTASNKPFQSPGSGGSGGDRGGGGDGSGGSSNSGGKDRNNTVSERHNSNDSDDDKPTRLPDPVRPMKARPTPQKPPRSWPKYGSKPEPKKRTIQINVNLTNKPKNIQKRPQPRTCASQIPGWNRLKLLPGLEGVENLSFSQCQVFESFRVPDSVSLASIERCAGCKPDIMIELKRSFSELNNVPKVVPQSVDGTPVVLVKITLQTLQYQWSGTQIQLGDELEYLWQLDNSYDLTIEQVSVLKACSRLYVEAHLGSNNVSKTSLAGWDFVGHDSVNNKGLFAEFVNKKCYLFHDLRKQTAELFTNTFAALITKGNATNLEEWIIRTKESPKLITKTVFGSRSQLCNGERIGDCCFCAFGYSGEGCATPMKIVQLPSTISRTAVLPFKAKSLGFDPPWEYLPLGSTLEGGLQRLIFSMSHGVLHSIVPLYIPTLFFMGNEVKMQTHQVDCQSTEYLCYTTKAHRISKLHLLGSAVTSVTLGNNQKYPIVNSQQFQDKYVHLSAGQQLASLKFGEQDTLYTVPEHVDCALCPGTNRFQFLQ
ncbi:hypothetical protein PSACC_03033 [Paramicrosporidium saccamoebae]|uniref:A-kinase anchor protein 7-like phosphoesterase domain-containing protein n=1 Tax=Paramicrosporidium saccamoebae TaxID=1246581 RepID=A0A2H9THP6_9FUNG|nr:hypothetical protein PSACC_03033 [Paramicrosporidium saccamoebae]